MAARGRDPSPLKELVGLFIDVPRLNDIPEASTKLSSLMLLLMLILILCLMELPREERRMLGLLLNRLPVTGSTCTLVLQQQ